MSACCATGRARVEGALACRDSRMRPCSWGSEATAAGVSPPLRAFTNLEPSCVGKVVRGALSANAR